MSKLKTIGEKKIGDTTSFTIPDEYTDIQTGEKSPVRPEMIDFINEHLKSRNLVHAIMTVIDNYITERTKEASQQKPEMTEEEQHVLQRIESKIDDLKQRLQSGQFVTADPTAATDISTQELDELLNEYF